MATWKGVNAGIFNFGVIEGGHEEQHPTIKPTSLSDLNDKPIIIHFYSDG